MLKSTRSIRFYVKENAGMYIEGLQTLSERLVVDILAYSELDDKERPFTYTIKERVIVLKYETVYRPTAMK